MTSTFRSPVLEAFWTTISSSLDRMEHVAADCTIDELNWRPPAPETNSIYVLLVHSLGHLRQGVMGVLGGGSQERDRDSEFLAIATADNVPVPGWAEIRREMAATLQAIPTEALEQTYAPINRAPMTGFALLMLMTRHTALHEGHAELTRDLAKAAVARS